MGSGLEAYWQLADTLALPGEARPRSPGICVTNQLLLQARQNHAAVILQHIAGIYLAVVLLTHQTECLDGVLQAAAYVQKHAVEEQVKWLMGAPAGYFQTCPHDSSFQPASQSDLDCSRIIVVSCSALLQSGLQHLK